MKKFIFKILSKFFRQQIIDCFIEEELPTYKIDMKDDKLMQSIVELTTSLEYRTFVKLQSNKKNSLGKKSLSLKYANEREAALKHSFLMGEAYNISHTLQMLKFIKVKYQSKKRSAKNKEEK